MTLARSIIFDFDGVLVESNEIRTAGFRSLFQGKNVPARAIEKLVEYHQRNGGLSRYNKIRYFFEHILRQPCDEAQLNQWCCEFSRLVKKDVTNAPEVNGAEKFLMDYSSHFQFFIVSGSDQSELREICQERGIQKYFKEILGSPTDKKTHLARLLEQYHLDRKNVVFVGDSRNDWEAASSVQIEFVLRDSGGAADLCARFPAIRDLTELPHRLNIEGVRSED